MADRVWQIICRHCRQNSDLNEDQLLARHLIGSIAVMKNPPDARQLLENYTIACPRCEGLLSFEPRSEYRRRKALAVGQRLERLVEELEAAPDEECRFLALAGKCGAIALKALETDMPLERLLSQEDKLLSGLADEIRDAGGDPKRDRGWRWLQETYAIACSDIGGRDDLPAAPMDEVAEKRAALLRSIGNLRNASPE